jgi:oxygen-independent coproporphyrinogen-3 oxidase
VTPEGKKKTKLLRIGRAARSDLCTSPPSFKMKCIPVALGLYISVPFCKTKCSYCNFASDVFSRDRMQAYVNRLLQDIGSARRTAEANGGRWEADADTIYLGGGTPTILEPSQIQQVFAALRQRFSVVADAEITVECAPGTLSAEMLAALVDCGVNRVSLGVQSFVDQEARAVGRLHGRAQALADISRLRAAGIFNLNLDLIAGLPYQTSESWDVSLKTAIDSGVSHVSVYLLEVDEDSRLGNELLAGGARYHAHFVPDESAMVEFYSAACEQLSAAGIHQYEISNFSRAGVESRHNLKYWKRLPYLGFGVDAHSMLLSSSPQLDAIRLATRDSLPIHLASYDDVQQIPRVSKTEVSFRDAWEETFFLGLRLNSGVSLREVEDRFGKSQAEYAAEIVTELSALGMMDVAENIIRLTPAGRMVSNEVFERFVSDAVRK